MTLRAGILPIVAAALVTTAMLQWHPALLARATEVTRGWVPSHPSAAVDVRGTRLRVRGAAAPQHVDVLSLAWNLPVLVCLWGWVVRRRWTWLLVASLVLVLAHVLVTDLSIRRAVGDLSGFPYEFHRAWYVWIAPLVPVVFVALGRYLGAGAKERTA